MTRLATSELPSLVVCPECRGSVEARGGSYDCTSCGRSHQVVDGIPVFVAASSDDAKRRQASWFDEHVDAEFEITRPHGTPALYQWYYKLKFDHATTSITPWVTDRTALTVCGGSGMDAEFLARRGARVISSDIALNAARRTRERALRYRLDVTPIVADAERLPFRDRSIDLVLVHDGLHHLEHPFVALREMTRVARYAVSIAEPARALATAVAVRLGLAQEIEDAGNRVGRFSLDEVGGVLENEGFLVLKAHRYAIYHKHEPGRLISALSRDPAFCAAKASIRTLNAVLGGMGNKLAVQGVRGEAFHDGDAGRGEHRRRVAVERTATVR